MPASPEAASNAGGVVEQLKLLANSGTHTLIDNMDLRALLAVVEAAEKVKADAEQAMKYSSGEGYTYEQGRAHACESILSALYTPDSAESKDAEGAKP